MVFSPKIKKLLISFSQKFPKLENWDRFFEILSKKEKIFFLSCFILFLISLLSLNLNFYLKNTKEIPAFDGNFREGLIGQPKFVNPLYLSTQDVDRDLVEILFKGLLKYNNQGKLIFDLAKNYKIKHQGKEYEFFLRDNLFWEDGKPLTINDVIFTVKLAQTPQYQSTLMKEWLGIHIVEENRKNAIKFSLPKSYFSFLETVTRLKILPKHIFQDLSPEHLPWILTSQQYLVGAGPFKLEKIKKDKSGFIIEFILERNKNYNGKKPFLQKISFKFYKTLSELLKAAKKGEIDGFSLSNLKYLENLSNFKAYHLSLPRYFAIFFNLKNGILEDKNIRKALTMAIDKKEILERVFLGNGEIISSPLLPNYYSLNPPARIFNFDLQKSQELLDKIGFIYNKEKKIREKVIIKENPKKIKKDLLLGAKGNQVKLLQKCLAQDKQVYPDGIISGYFGPKTKKAVIKFQEKYTQDVLIPLGLKNGTGKVGALTRKKINEICFPSEKKFLSLKFSLTTVDKFPLPEIAKILKTQWEKIGVEVKIKKVSLAELETDVLKKRSFETLLFGESLGTLLDPFPFWHSSQKEYPGLNISNFVSKNADRLLEKIREVRNLKARKKLLEELQEILIEEIPAIFLVQPHYVYVLHKKVKGFEMKKIIEPSKRFTNIENWYIKTKRVWK